MIISLFKIFKEKIVNYKKAYKIYKSLMSDEADNKNSCSMVGLLGILIQVGLGALSFSVLIVKRYF